MKYQHKPQPRVGDKQYVTKFLWFPMRIGDETRWLEKAMYVREYRGFFKFKWAEILVCPLTDNAFDWFPVRWCNEFETGTRKVMPFDSRCACGKKSMSGCPIICMDCGLPMPLMTAEDFTEMASNCASDTHYAGVVSQNDLLLHVQEQARVAEDDHFVKVSGGPFGRACGHDRWVNIDEVKEIEH